MDINISYDGILLVSLVGISMGFLVMIVVCLRLVMDVQKNRGELREFVAIYGQVQDMYRIRSETREVSRLLESVQYLNNQLQRCISLQTTMALVARPRDQETTQTPMFLSNAPPVPAADFPLDQAVIPVHPRHPTAVHISPVSVSTPITSPAPVPASPRQILDQGIRDTNELVFGSIPGVPIPWLGPAPCTHLPLHASPTRDVSLPTKIVENLGPLPELLPFTPVPQREQMIKQIRALYPTRILFPPLPDLPKAENEALVPLQRILRELADQRDRDEDVLPDLEPFTPAPLNDQNTIQEIHPLQPLPQLPPMPPLKPAPPPPGINQDHQPLEDDQQIPIKRYPSCFGCPHEAVLLSNSPDVPSTCVRCFQNLMEPGILGDYSAPVAIDVQLEYVVHKATPQGR